MLSPLALLWLLPIGGIITALYLLKQKRKETRVPSLLLWEALLKETSAATLFQKLRRDPLLFLQLLAALLLCIALARPFLMQGALGGKNVAIVLDASASMSATDVPGGRLAAAVKQARALIERKGATDSIAIIRSGTRAEVIQPPTTDRSKLLAALDRVTPTDGVTGPRESVLLAASLVASRQDAAVTLITDGAFARQDELSLGGATLNTVIVGQTGAAGSANVGITAFDVRETQSDSGDSGVEAFVTVENAGTASRTVPLELRVGDTLVEARDVALGAEESKSLTVPLSPEALPKSGGLLTARIESADALASDNEAYASLPSHAAVRALLVSSGDDPFLERALSLVPRVTVTKESPGLFATADAGKYDLTIWDADAAPPADLPPGRYLFFGAVPSGAVSPATALIGANLSGPTVLDFDRASPLLRFADLDGVRIREAAHVSAAPWASVVAEGKDGPLILAGEHAGSRVAYAAFRPTQSDFPLRVAFPVFVSNAVSYLAVRDDTENTHVIRPGETVALPAAATSVVRPDGGTDTVSGGIFGNTDKAGVYRINGASGEITRFGVALLAPAETEIAPIANPPIVVTDDPNADPKTAKSNLAPHEWWPWLAGALLLLLAFEWLFFQRLRRA